MSDHFFSGNFFRNARGIDFVDTATAVWSYDAATNQLTVDVSVGSGGIADHSVTNVKLAQAPAHTLKGNNTGSTADEADLTVSDVKTMLAIAYTDVSGLATVAHTGAYSDLSGTPTLAAIATSGSATDLVAGTVPTARLGTGTANSTTFLRGDQTWQAVSSYTSPLTTKGDLLGHSTVDARVPIGADGKILMADSAQTLGLKWTDNYQPRFQRGASFSAGTAAIVTPVNNVPIYIPEDCTITEVEVLTQGGTGSCLLDIWKVAYGSYPPTSGNSITASAKPTITAGIKYQDQTLTGWTTACSAGDTLLVNLTSSSTFTSIMLVLTMRITGSTAFDGYTDARAIAVTVGSSTTALSGELDFYTDGVTAHPMATLGRSTAALTNTGGFWMGSNASPVAGAHAASFSFGIVADSTGNSDADALQGIIIKNKSTSTTAINYALEAANGTAGHECIVFVTSTGFSGTVATGGPSGEQKGISSVDGTPLVFGCGSIIPLYITNTAGVPAILGLGPVAGAAVDMTPDKGTFSATHATGFSGTPSAGTWIWARHGNHVTLFFPSTTGTSTATGWTISGLPAAIQPARSQHMPVAMGAVQDNTAQAASVDIVITTSGTMTMKKTGLAAGWTASGTKGFVNGGGCVSYLLN